MAQHIAILHGHPDPRGNRFGHALADAYAEGAKAAGHELRRIDVATLEFPLLRNKEDFESGVASEAIRQAQSTIRWADHIVIFFPLWLGEMPALLKAFLEQVFRPGFAFEASKTGGLPKKLLAGKSARIVVTMGMPAFFYRWYYGAHGLKNLKRNILGFAGFRPIKDTLIGMIEARNIRHAKWLDNMRTLGRAAR
jgi:putative NADPH-quinone reductase